MGNNKRFFSKHAKSSAIVVSLAVHGILIILALSMVAITVITKEEVDFEARQVKRPNMQLKKLQVPVNVKKPPQQPKLRQQIVAKPRVNRMPDIKMPEITGVKGGLGSAGGGGFGTASLGFSMPEFNLFGIKGKGEKVFIILDATKAMVHPEIGGVPAYALIKNELVKILDGLPSTTLFNISVYDKWNSFLLFPKMVPASKSNVAKAKSWLDPLNSIDPERAAAQYGTGTLGPGGTKANDDFRTGKFESQERWHRPVMIAMKEQADAVFLLTNWWGEQRIMRSDTASKAWYDSAAGRKWMECWDKAKAMYAEENRQRKAKGEPPIVLSTDNAWIMNDYYFPGIERPPEMEFYYYTPREFYDGMLEIRKQYDPDRAASSTRLRGGRIDFTFNVIHLKKAGGEESEWIEGRTRDNFTKLTSLFGGEYRVIKGLEGIKSLIQN